MGEDINVIEVIEEMVAKIKELYKQLQNSQEMNKAAMEVIKFYGEHENWCSLIDGKYNLGKIWVATESGFGMTTENGKRAREFLSKWGKK